MPERIRVDAPSRPEAGGRDRAGPRRLPREGDDVVDVFEGGVLDEVGRDVALAFEGGDGDVVVVGLRAGRGERHEAARPRHEIRLAEIRHDDAIDEPAIAVAVLFDPEGVPAAGFGTFRRLNAAEGAFLGRAPVDMPEPARRQGEENAAHVRADPVVSLAEIADAHPE